MRTVLLQFDIQWGDVQQNIRKAEALMVRQPEADLYVLPEMWSTGFTSQPEEMAEQESLSFALKWMKSQAKLGHCAVCGSLCVKLADGSFRNRMYFVTPDDVKCYDKRHLFTPSGEHEHYGNGTEHTIVEWSGMRFLLLVCYDLRFPVWSRYGVAGEYDAIIYVANWPQSRQQAWHVLLQARAMENQCYVIAVNRVGDDPISTYAGDSMVIDPIGRVIAECKSNAEQPLVAVLSMEELMKSRTRFKVLQDRDCIYRV